MRTIGDQFLEAVIVAATERVEKTLLDRIERLEHQLLALTLARDECEPSTPDALLSGVEVASMLGVKVGTLAKWRCNGVGPKYRKVGRMVRYRLADVLPPMNG